MNNNFDFDNPSITDEILRVATIRPAVNGFPDHLVAKIGNVVDVPGIVRQAIIDDGWWIEVNKGVLFAGTDDGSTIRTFLHRIEMGLL